MMNKIGYLALILFTTVCSARAQGLVGAPVSTQMGVPYAEVKKPDDIYEQRRKFALALAAVCLLPMCWSVAFSRPKD